VRVFCLTDHDTCQGYAATRDALAGSGVQVLRGVELSCRALGRTIHVLVYGVRDGAGHDALHERLLVQRTARIERLRAICDRLARLGIALDPEAVLRRTHGVPGRPDVARALVAAGVCSSPREAFTRFLRDGGPADVSIDRVSLEQGLALGRAAGARMSLAHPHSIGEPALVRELYRKHRDAGLEGLEAFYGKYGRAEANAWLRMCDELDLVATGGSDFHGDMAPEVARPGIEFPDDRATRLLEWIDQ
jgi:predicted metal-dependent phosphoesterase TrpH